MSPSARADLEFMTIDEIVNILKVQECLADAPDDFVREIAARLYKSVLYFSWLKN